MSPFGGSFTGFRASFRGGYLARFGSGRSGVASAACLLPPAPRSHHVPEVGAAPVAALLRGRRLAVEARLVQIDLRDRLGPTTLLGRGGRVLRGGGTERLPIPPTAHPDNGVLWRAKAPASLKATEGVVVLRPRLIVKRRPGNPSSGSMKAPLEMRRRVRCTEVGPLGAEINNGGERLRRSIPPRLDSSGMSAPRTQPSSKPG